MQFCNSVSASSAFSLIAFETAFFFYLFNSLYILLFFSVLFWHIAMFASFFLKTASFTSSFNHHVSPLLLPSSSNTPHHMPLRPHPWSVPTNLVLQHQLIWLLFLEIASWSSHLSAKLSFFSQQMSFSPLSLFSSYLYLLSLRHVEIPQGLLSHFE